jgi:hypothetical protein
MRSLNADAFHSVDASKGPAIIGCTAKFQGDDCVNIHGMYDVLLSASGNQIRAVTIHGCKIQPGDPVEFLPFSGARPADAIAEKIEPDAPMTKVERDFFRKVHMLPQSKTNLIGGGKTCYKLTLDRPVTLPMGSALCSGNHIGNGFLVKDCDFGYNRSRGILIKASHGQVIDNTIAHGWMMAVLVTPEYWWLESSCPSDVLIRGNKIIGCRRQGIEVTAPGGDGKLLPSGAHRDITIEGNTFVDSAWPNIHVTSTDHLMVKDNILTQSEPTDIVPPIAHPWSWAGSPVPILVELCSHADVQKSPAPPP